MIQKTISGNDIVSEAIDRIREYEPENGYYLAFSGGKDSICIYQLSKLAGVKFRAVYHMTSIDPKGVPQFIRKYYPDVEIVKPTYKGKRTNFYDLVSQKGLPRRQYRWCCDVLKEGGGNKGDTVMLGVRQAESLKRSKRELFCKHAGKYQLLPIFDWSDVDVWDFIKSNHYLYPPLYDEGHKRLGCVLCPLACNASRVRDYNEYPERVRALELAVNRLLEKNPDSSLKKWGNTAEEIVRYWVYQSPKQSAKGVCLGDFINKE